MIVFATVGELAYLMTQKVLATVGSRRFCAVGRRFSPAIESIVDRQEIRTLDLKPTLRKVRSILRTERN